MKKIKIIICAATLLFALTSCESVNPNETKEMAAEAVRSEYNLGDSYVLAELRNERWKPGIKCYALIDKTNQVYYYVAIDTNHNNEIDVETDQDTFYELYKYGSTKTKEE